VTVTEGESVTLECQISGHPTPAIMWFREDYRIEHSIDFQITYESSYACLVIREAFAEDSVREAFAEDSGRFTCTATSEAGTISTSCYLLVKGKIMNHKIDHEIWLGLKQNDPCIYGLIFNFQSQKTLKAERISLLLLNTLKCLLRIDGELIESFVV